MREALDALKARRPRLLVISDDERALARADVALPLWTRVPEWLSPLLAVVPGQIAAMRLAQLRGIDLDSPLGLSKVTLTR
jgi:glucosamine--fructose-6-phosphate aminotransferase (isomerizing)